MAEDEEKAKDPSPVEGTKERPVVERSTGQERGSKRPDASGPARGEGPAPRAGPKPGKEGPQAPEKREEDPPKKRVSRSDNVIFVGRKPAMSYVMAVVTQFSGGASEVDIRARGKSISRAVDVAEVVRNRFVQDAGYRVELGTDQVQDEQGNRINVSSISILLSK